MDTGLPRSFHRHRVGSHAQHSRKAAQHEDHRRHLEHKSNQTRRSYFHASIAPPSNSSWVPNRLRQKEKDNKTSKWCHPHSETLIDWDEDKENIRLDNHVFHELGIRSWWQLWRCPPFELPAYSTKSWLPIQPRKCGRLVDEQPVQQRFHGSLPSTPESVLGGSCPHRISTPTCRHKEWQTATAFETCTHVHSWPVTSVVALKYVGKLKSCLRLEQVQPKSLDRTRSSCPVYVDLRGNITIDLSGRNELSNKSIDTINAWIIGVTQRIDDKQISLKFA